LENSVKLFSFTLFTGEEEGKERKEIVQAEPEPSMLHRQARLSKNETENRK